METTKHLIIQLLVHDIRHEQLVAGMAKLGFNSDIHGTDMCGVVAELMGIAEEEMSWDWADIYMDFLSHALKYDVSGNGKNLMPLVEAYYTLLTECADREKRIGKAMEQKVSATGEQI